MIVARNAIPFIVQPLPETTQVPGGGAGVGAGGSPTFKSKLGSPVCKPLRTPAMALARKTLRTPSPATNVGFSSSNNAAAPATCGAAMLVPLLVEEPESEV